MKPYLPTAGPAAPRSGNVPARILPFAAYLLFIALADLLPAGGLTAWRWLYAAKIAAVAALLWAYRRHYVELARFDLGARLAAVAVAAGLLVFALWISLDAAWMQIGTAAGFDPRHADSGAIDWPLALVRVAGAAVVVPVMEELFWRSFLLRWLHSVDFLALAPARVGVRALAISALLFGVEHNLWLAGVVAGVAYSLLYMRSGSLWAAVVAHGVTNGALGIWVLATGNWHYW